MRISDWSSDVCSSDLATSHKLKFTRSPSSLCHPCRAPRSPKYDPAETARRPISSPPCDRQLAPSKETDEMRHTKIEIRSAVDRKSVVKGKRVSVRVDLGGRRIIKKKNNKTKNQ